LARLHDAESLDVLAASAPCLVVEAALEDLGAKRAIFWALDEATPPTAILATNTSALAVGAIAAPTAHPDRVIGLHFFNPAPVMPLVEVVATSAADPAILDRASALMTAWGKVPVRCRDTPGCRQPGQSAVHARSARDARRRRASIEGIDAYGQESRWGRSAHGHRRDRHQPRRSPWGLRGAARWRSRGTVPASPIQEHLVRSRARRKTDGGFYRYEDGRPVAPRGDIGVHLGGATLDGSAIAARIELAIVNEATTAGDGVATPADIGLACASARTTRWPVRAGGALGGPAVLALPPRDGKVRTVRAMVEALP
jgi:3-hydroxyacyl-CoA dehydrogenase